ncbi:ParA family protein [Kineosporia sp. NBRC 101731]|uniref:ParA family protein n=1 Tax=Kineosporia sp. NBRC 101731 TaxID=3032199 RepID=UPI0025546B20|nr:ParA family protein [Kineosporia sp. NBRC 101731]
MCSLKGGVGKTSVVLGLASAALARGVPTLVVDIDPQADATLGLDITAEITTNVATVMGASRRNAQKVNVVPSGWATGDGTLDVLPGSHDMAALDRPTGSERTLARLSHAIHQLEGYQLVLIDCPPSLGTITRSGLAASQRALVVSEPALFSVTAADRALHAIDEVRRNIAPTLQPLGVVVNRYRERSPEHRYRLQELSDMFGPLVLGPSIRERSALQQAQGASQPIHRWPGAPAQELAHAFDAHLARVLRANTRGRRPASAEVSSAPAEASPA